MCCLLLTSVTFKQLCSRSHHGDVCMCPNNLYYNENSGPRPLIPAESPTEEREPVIHTAEPMTKKEAGSDRQQPQQHCSVEHISLHARLHVQIESVLEASSTPAPRHLVSCLSNAPKRCNMMSTLVEAAVLHSKMTTGKIPWLKMFTKLDYQKTLLETVVVANFN